MTGLLLLFVTIIWLIIALLLANWLTCKLPNRWWRALVRIVLFVALVLLPLVDEMIGKWQFEALCKKYAVQTIDEKNAWNRKVFSIGREQGHYAQNTTVQIHIQSWIYQDTETREILASYHSLHAEGGWLIRMLKISEGNHPLIFDAGCGPVNERDFLKKFNITILN